MASFCTAPCEMYRMKCHKQINMILIRNHSQMRPYPITAAHIATHRLRHTFNGNLSDEKVGSVWKLSARGGRDGYVAGIDFENINYKMYVQFCICNKFMENHEQKFSVATTRNINLPLFNKFHPKLYLFKVFNHFIHSTEQLSMHTLRHTHTHTPHRE